jgi:hypothetical protein
MSMSVRREEAKVPKQAAGIRPFQWMSTSEVLTSLQDRKDKADLSLDALVQAWIELKDLRNVRKAKRVLLEELFVHAGAKPEPWFGAALHAARGVTRETKGNHHLYVLMYDGYGEDGLGVGLYVGRSRYTPERRFAQHKSGLAEQNAARRFRLDRPGKKYRPLALLPSFYEHLNTLSVPGAKVLEETLVKVMLLAGVPPDRLGGPRGNQQMTPEPEGDD